jgi:hypothetical protein
MTDLSPQTRALLEDGGDVVPMSPSHRARLRRTILAKVAAGAAVATTSTAAASTGGAFAIAEKFFAIGAAVGVVGGGARLAWHATHSPATVAMTASPASPPTPPAPYMPTAEQRAPAAESRAAESPLAEPRVPAIPPAVKRAAAPLAAEPAPPPELAPPPAPESSAKTRAALRLREEARLLRDANEALKEGAAARALDLLDEHAARFPDGVLEPERAAQRVFALCRAGRVDEARQARERFLAAVRPPLLAARVRATCASPDEK